MQCHLRYRLSRDNNNLANIITKLPSLYPSSGPVILVWGPFSNPLAIVTTTRLCLHCFWNSIDCHPNIMDKDIQLNRFIKKRELFINPILRKKNQEPTNSNPKIYHGQMYKVWKGFCVLGHSQNFEQWVVEVVLLDCHHAWRSLDPTLDICSDFVKKA